MNESLAKTDNNICLNYCNYDSMEELLNMAIKSEDMDTNLISDGYHTFGELYEHRIVNFVTVCKMYKSILIYGHNVWRSKKHSDGELAFGGTWFVLGIGKEQGKQITYHLPIEKWESTSFAETLGMAPEWDGHTSQDVLERLSKL